jgi:hypothetical protein
MSPAADLPEQVVRKKSADHQLLDDANDAVGAPRELNGSRLRGGRCDSSRKRHDVIRALYAHVAPHGLVSQLIGYL